MITGDFNGNGLTDIALVRQTRVKEPGAPEEIAAATDGFFFVQSLRLRAQLLARPGAPALSHNRLNPDLLNEVDRRMLKEAFRKARKLQARLILDYQL